MTLSDNIRELRRAKKLTQEQLAEAMGVSTASVSKWETGQAAPELTMLVTLADYFQVSVDAMLDHEISGDHMEALLDQMEKLIDAKESGPAKAIAEKLVRAYPNTYKVIEAASNVYSTAFLVEQDRANMERAIQLTHRLFALAEDPTGAKRFELLSKLANHYEMLEDWDMARKYYKEGNVGRMNDRSLARCLANAGKNREAVGEISDVFAYGVFELLSDAIMLEQVWQKLEKPEKAEAALRWGCQVVKLSGDVVAKKFAMAAVAMYVELARLEERRGDHDSADAHIRDAMATARTGFVETENLDFLEVSKLHVMVEGRKSHEDLVLAWLSREEDARLLEVAKGEVKKA